MEKRRQYQNARKRLRWFALGCLAGVACVCAVSGGATDQRDTERACGDLLGDRACADERGFVVVPPPASPMFQMAKERGYLATGPSAAGTAALIKQVAALGDDRV